MKYYDYNRLLSYNAVYNFVVDRRGSGKSYGAKRRAIREALKGNHFIYIRRFKEELLTATATFFSDVEHEFPEYEFRVISIGKLRTGQVALAATRDDKKREWKNLGYFIALSQAQMYKSSSFPTVQNIIFDEFILEKSLVNYLPNEAKLFNGLYSTIARTRENVRVLFLANSVTIMNPYFSQYGIKPNDDPDKEFVIKFNGFVAAHFPKSTEFKEHASNTRYGKFLQEGDTEYFEYAVGNTFADNHENLLGDKDPKARYQFTLETATGIFSVWVNFFTGEYYAQAKRPAKETIFTMLHDKMDEDKTLIVFKDRPLSDLRTAYRHARMTFDSANTRNTFSQIFKR